MFSVTLSQPLTSKHFFPDLKGSEREVHAHQYRVEITVMGEHLDECGFLVNVDLIATSLEKVLRRFEGKILNRMKDFHQRPPSMENLAKVIWSRMAEEIDQSCIERIRVVIWETDDISASFDERC
jgi:6-pyruvoyltetrahydropterin/6-carboxytetrahydropterin synthase